jgi:hypothetical protein
MAAKKGSGKKGKKAAKATGEMMASELSMRDHLVAILEELEEIGEDFLKQVTKRLKRLRKAAKGKIEDVRREREAGAAARAPVKKAAVKRRGVATKKAPVKKAAAKRTAARKAGVKKAPARKPAPRKAASKKAAPMPTAAPPARGTV